MMEKDEVDGLDYDEGKEVEGNVGGQSLEIFEIVTETVQDILNLVEDIVLRGKEDHPEVELDRNKDEDAIDEEMEGENI
jgi:hypothetical protein